MHEVDDEGNELPPLHHRRLTDFATDAANQGHRARQQQIITLRRAIDRIHTLPIGEHHFKPEFPFKELAANKNQQRHLRKHHRYRMVALPKGGPPGDVRVYAGWFRDQNLLILGGAAVKTTNGRWQDCRNCRPVAEQMLRVMEIILALHGTTITADALPNLMTVYDIIL